MESSHHPEQQTVSQRSAEPELALSMKTAIAEFPRLFRGAPPQIPGWVLPGWGPLLRQLLQSIDGCLTDEQAKAFRVVQIKEKFGSLRFYFYAPEEIRSRVNDLVEAARQSSEATCLRCGRPAVLATDNGAWMSVLCDQHMGTCTPVSLADR